MSEPNIYQRLNQIIQRGKAVPKDGEMSGPGGNYKFQRADDIVSHLRPELAQHGIAFEHSVTAHSIEHREVETSKGTRTERVTVKTVKCRLVNVDEPSDFIEGEEVGYGIDSQDKGPGKATSYAIKTWLLNVFMLRGQPDEESKDQNVKANAGEKISKTKAAGLRLLLKQLGLEEDDFCAKFRIEGSVDNLGESRYENCLHWVQQQLTENER